MFRSTLNLIRVHYAISFNVCDSEFDTEVRLKPQVADSTEFSHKMLTFIKRLHDLKPDKSFRIALVFIHLSSDFDIKLSQVQK